MNNISSTIDTTTKRQPSSSNESTPVDVLALLTLWKSQNKLKELSEFIVLLVAIPLASRHWLNPSTANPVLPVKKQEPEILRQVYEPLRILYCHLHSDASENTVASEFVQRVLKTKTVKMERTVLKDLPSGMRAQLASSHGHEGVSASKLFSTYLIASRIHEKDHPYCSASVELDIKKAKQKRVLFLDMSVITNIYILPIICALILAKPFHLMANEYFGMSKSWKSYDLDKRRKQRKSSVLICSKIAIARGDEANARTSCAINMTVLQAAIVFIRNVLGNDAGLSENLEKIPFQEYYTARSDYTDSLDEKKTLFKTAINFADSRETCESNLCNFKISAEDIQRLKAKALSVKNDTHSKASHNVKQATGSTASVLGEEDLLTEEDEGSEVDLEDKDLENEDDEEANKDVYDEEDLDDDEDEENVEDEEDEEDQNKLNTEIIVKAKTARSLAHCLLVALSFYSNTPQSEAAIVDAFIIKFINIIRSKYNSPILTDSQINYIFKGENSECLDLSLYRFNEIKDSFYSGKPKLLATIPDSSRSESIILEVSSKSPVLQAVLHSNTIWGKQFYTVFVNPLLEYVPVDNGYIHIHVEKTTISELTQAISSLKEKRLGQKLNILYPNTFSFSRVSSIPVQLPTKLSSSGSTFGTISNSTPTIKSTEPSRSTNLATIPSASTTSGHISEVVSPKHKIVDQTTSRSISESTTSTHVAKITALKQETPDQTTSSIIGDSISASTNTAKNNGKQETLSKCSTNPDSITVTPTVTTTTSTHAPLQGCTTVAAIKSLTTSGYQPKVPSSSIESKASNPRVATSGSSCVQNTINLIDDEEDTPGQIKPATKDAASTHKSTLASVNNSPVTQLPRMENTSVPDPTNTRKRQLTDTDGVEQQRKFLKTSFLIPQEYQEAAELTTCGTIYEPFVTVKKVNERSSYEVVLYSNPRNTRIVHTDDKHGLVVFEVKAPACTKFYKLTINKPIERMVDDVAYNNDTRTVTIKYTE